MLCAAKVLSRRCLNWVNSCLQAMSASRPQSPQQRRKSGHSGTSHLCQFRTKCVAAKGFAIRSPHRRERGALAVLQGRGLWPFLRLTISWYFVGAILGDPAERLTGFLAGAVCCCAHLRFHGRFSVSPSDTGSSRARKSSASSRGTDFAPRVDRVCVVRRRSQASFKGDDGRSLSAGICNPVSRCRSNAS
jgi:hypothetical protein